MPVENSTDADTRLDAAPTDDADAKPWIELAELIAHDADPAQVVEYLEALSPNDTALAISRLAPDLRNRLIVLLPPEDAADLIGDLAEEQATDLIEEAEPSHAAAIIDALPSADQADLLGELDPEDAEAILDKMDAGRADAVRELLAFADDTAGGIMITEFLSYREDSTVGDILSDLRANAETYSDYEVQYAYITNDANKLSGVLRLRDLLLSPPQKTAGDLMIPRPLRVNVATPLPKLISLFEERSFIGVPVVDASDRLVGVLRKSAVLEAAEEAASQTFLSFSGIIGGEELRSMPLFSRCLRRLAFLVPNILLNLIAVSVIARYEETLEAVIALAIFLPVISDMSGCSGNQAVAVSIRELTLGLIRPTEFLRIVFKEGTIGIMNGLILGLLLGVVAAIWKGPAMLGVVIGSALTLNTIISVLMGGSVPLLLRKLKIDPALASGPILTTVTDLVGFFLVLSIANRAMEHLLG